MAKEPIYKISFFNQGKVYEIYAKHVFQSDLWGFLEVEEFVFGERSQMIVDPSEEKLKNEFTGVKRSFILFRQLLGSMKLRKRVHVKLLKQVRAT